MGEIYTNGFGGSVTVAGTVGEQGLLATCMTGTGEELDTLLACAEQWFSEHPNSFSKPDDQAKQDLWAALSIYRDTLDSEERKAADELNSRAEVGLFPAEQKGLEAPGKGAELALSLIPNGVTLLEFTQVATTSLLSGEKLQVRDKAGNATRRRLSMVSADPSIALPFAGTEGDPTSSGALLELLNPTTGEAAVFVLPAAHWAGLGTPPGSAGYRYKDAVQVAGPCKTVEIREGRIRASCKGSRITFTLDERWQGSLGVRLTAGTAIGYCLLFGGTVWGDTPGLFKAASAPAPANCPAG